MYTRQEISKQKQAFWTAFGRYMKPVLSADGEEISWINYKTGNKHVSFKMDAESREAQIAIVVQHAERIYFDRFLQLKEIFAEAVLEDDWNWERDSMDEQGRALKPRIIALDSFWSMVRYQFSNL